MSTRLLQWLCCGGVGAGGGIFGILGNHKIFNMAVVARREMGGGRVFLEFSEITGIFNMAVVARREMGGGRVFLEFSEITRYSIWRRGEEGGGGGGVWGTSRECEYRRVRRNGAGVDFCIFSRPAGGRWPICGILLWVASAGKAWWAADIWLGVGGDSSGGVGGGRGVEGGWLGFCVGGGFGSMVGV